MVSHTDVSPSCAPAPLALTELHVRSFLSLFPHCVGEPFSPPDSDHSESHHREAEDLWAPGIVLGGRGPIMGETQGLSEKGDYRVMRFAQFEGGVRGVSHGRGTWCSPAGTKGPP